LARWARFSGQTKHPHQMRGRNERTYENRR
jgi:hypothetical protein